MLSNNISIVVIISAMCFVINAAYLFDDEEDMIHDTNYNMMKQYSLFKNQYRSKDDTKNVKKPSDSNNHNSESAERYFDWATKTQRPVEFLRGKRFWLFAKKDENGMSVEFTPPEDTSQTPLTQGLWRSGIVGRRRRR